MNFARLSENQDFVDMWESPQVQSKLELYAHSLLDGEYDERARGALEMAHFLRTLPSYESQRTAEPPRPIQRISVKRWLLGLLDQVTTTNPHGAKPKEGVRVV